MSEITVAADSFRTAISQDGRDVRLTFTQKGNTFHIAMPVQIAQAVVDQLEQTIDGQSMTAIPPNELARAAKVKIVGRHIRIFSGKQKQMVVLLEVGGRRRSFPVNLSDADVASLIADLS